MSSSHLDSVPTPHSDHGSRLKSPSLHFCPLCSSASDVIFILGLNIVQREEGKIGDAGPILHRRSWERVAGSWCYSHTARSRARASQPAPSHSSSQEINVACAAANTSAKMLVSSLPDLPRACFFRLFIFSL